MLVLFIVLIAEIGDFTVAQRRFFAIAYIIP